MLLLLSSHPWLYSFLLYLIGISSNIFIVTAADSISSSHRILSTTTTSSTSTTTATTSTTIEPTLPLSNVNVIVLTDVHSWIAGHATAEPKYDADYGHVVSFYERLKLHCDSMDHDLWFVVNGDWIDGTGLAMNGDPSHLIPLLEKMPWDIVNTGNHELYKDSVIKYMTRPGGFVSWWGDRHLSSNILWNDTNNHNSNSNQQQERTLTNNRYKILKGKHSNLLVFGFLYNMEGASPLVTIQHVEDAVQEHWFLNVVKDTSAYDAILVMAHIGTYDALIEIVLDKLRSITGPNMPIQFLTGHTHYRQFEQLDTYSTAFEAGRYLDTIGFVSFPTKQTVLQEKETANDVTMETNTPDTTFTNNTLDDNADTNATLSSSSTSTPQSLFHHVFLDANVNVLQNALGISENLQTPTGLEVSTFIQKTRDELGLTDILGCSSQPYYLNRSLQDTDSLWGLYSSKVAPTQLPHLVETYGIKVDSKDMLRPTSIQHDRRKRTINDENADSAMAEDTSETPKHDKPSKSSTTTYAAMFLSQDSWRYDLVGGDSSTISSSRNKHFSLQVDDIIAVAPFNDTVLYLGPIPGWLVLRLNDTLNNPINPPSSKFLPKLPWYILAGNVSSDEPCHVFSHSFEYQTLVNELVNQSDGRWKEPDPIIVTDAFSTGMWLSFVGDYWSCSGSWNSRQPPTYSSSWNSQDEFNGSETTFLGVFITSLLGTIGLMMGAVMACFYWDLTGLRSCRSDSAEAVALADHDEATMIGIDSIATLQIEEGEMT